MEISQTGVIAFVGLGIVTVLREYLVAFLRILFANIFRGGEYNLDGDFSTADWCEMTNPAAQWYMVKILEYHFFYRLVQVRDADGGLHEMRIRTLDFINAPSRALSLVQRTAVYKAGNDWPEMELDQRKLALADRISRLEKQTKEVQHIILRDMCNIFKDEKDALALSERLLKIEEKLKIYVERPECTPFDIKLEALPWEDNETPLNDSIMSLVICISKIPHSIERLSSAVHELRKGMKERSECKCKPTKSLKKD